jgi:hypothetical protein
MSKVEVLEEEGRPAMSCRGSIFKEWKIFSKDLGLCLDSYKLPLKETVEFFKMSQLHY